MRKYRGIRYSISTKRTDFGSKKYVVSVFIGGSEYQKSDFRKDLAKALAFSFIDQYIEDKSC